MYWLRPGIERSAPLPARVAGETARWTLDTALFDVDGVLIDTSRSYRFSVIAAADRLVRTVQGLPDAPEPLVTPDDVAAFKLAGGFNNDWHLTQALAALSTARLREWRGQPEGTVTLAEWAQRAGAAAREQRGGLAWLLATVPASALPDATVARWAHDEYYWGARLVREMYGHEPLYAPDAPGLVTSEVLLLDGSVFPALRDLGLQRLGLITGRNGPEVAWVARQIVAGSGLAEGEPPLGVAFYAGPHGRTPFVTLVTGDDYTKPDPHALVAAVRGAGARGALYVGDTADDLDLVLRYREQMQPSDATLPPTLAVMVAQGDERATYQRRGADIVLGHVGELPAALLALAARAAPSRQG